MTAGRVVWVSLTPHPDARAAVAAYDAGEPVPPRPGLELVTVHRGGVARNALAVGGHDGRW